METHRVLGDPAVPSAAIVHSAGGNGTGGAARLLARRALNDLPVPSGGPFIGNAHQLKLHTLHRTLNDWARAFGPIYRFRMGRRRAIAVSSPELCQEVLRARPDIFRRVSSIESVASEIGIAGSFFTEGATWRKQRALSMQVLSQRNLRGFYPTLKTVVIRLKKRWERKCDANETIDLVSDMKRFGLDVTTFLTFGYDANTLEQDGNAIQSKLAFVVETLNRRVFGVIPLWRYIRLPRDRRLERALADLRSWLGEHIAASRAQLEAYPERASHPSNFLDAIISSKDETGKPYTDDTIFANLMTLLAAGEESSAFVTSWAIHEMCNSPQSVETLRQEASALLGEADVPLDVEDVAMLPFAEAIVHEAMRLRQISPIIMLETNADTVVGDAQIPASTSIAVLIQPAAVDERHFDNPHAFMPERWLEAHAGVQTAAASMPFGFGPRICPGRMLAVLQMKMVLAMLYKNFSVDRVTPADQVCDVFEFLVRPAPLHVRLKRAPRL